MALFGNTRSSTNQESNNNEFTNANYGANAQNFNISQIGRGAKGPVSVAITSTDYGAIEGGIGLARDALAGGLQSFNASLAGVLSQSSAVVDKTLGIAAKTQVSESAQFQDTLLKLALVGASGFALVAFAKKRG